MADDVIQITPNTVVSNSDTRRRIGNALWLLSLAAGVVALFFAFFPEAAFGTDVPTRVVAFINALVSLGAGSFGLIVVRPNTPKIEDAVPVATAQGVILPLPNESREEYRARTGGEFPE